MRSVGLKVLKHKLCEYVRLAARGEIVLITDRDRVVAELSPPRESRPPAIDDAQIAELVRTGLLRPALLPPGPPPPVARVAPRETLLEELGEDRSER